MLLLPLRLELPLSRLPYLTLLICGVCTAVLLQQFNSAEHIHNAAQSFCAQDHERIFRVTLGKLTGKGDSASCTRVITAVAQHGDAAARIAEIAATTEKFTTFDLNESQAFVKEQLTQKYEQFLSTHPEATSLTASLMYYPDSYNPFSMISSVFAHADWSHLIGNLIFFFAFGAAVEVALGYFAFSLSFIVLTIGTNLAYSLSLTGLSDSAPTLGLSGVVMGMIGLFAFLMPAARIKCFLWFIVLFRIIAVPAWILAVWYIGWDIYNLSVSGAQSGINFVAHVSGAAVGFVYGIAFFRNRKAQISAELRQIRARQEDAKVAAGVLG